MIVGLVLLLPLVPPETRAESMLGCALLALLACTLSWRAHPFHGHGWLVAVAVLLAALGRAALAPGAAVAPVGTVVLAAGLGLAAWSAAGAGRQRQLVTGLAAAGTVVSVHALYQKLWGLDRTLASITGDVQLPDRDVILAKLEAGRAFAGFPTPAALGGFLALALPITFAVAVASSGRVRWLWWAGVALEGLALTASASVTATVALAGAVIVGLVVRGGSVRLPLVAVGVTALMLAAVTLQRDGPLLDPGHADSPWRLRAGNARVGYAMAGEQPWLGVGPGGYAESYERYRQLGDNEARHAHHLPAELAAEYGWPLGLAATLAFFVIFLGPILGRFAGRGHDPPWTTGAAIGLAAFALHNLADFTAFLPSMLWLAALVRGSLAHPPVPVPGRSLPVSRVLAAASLVAVAAGAVALSADGLGRDLRRRARQAAFAEDSTRAQELARRAVAVAPWNVDGRLLLVRILDGGADALRQADQAVRLSPVRSSARQLRAQMRLRAGDLPGAYSELLQSRRLDPLHHGLDPTVERLRWRLDSPRQ